MVASYHNGAPIVCPAAISYGPAAHQKGQPHAVGLEHEALSNCRFHPSQTDFDLLQLPLQRQTRSQQHQHRFYRVKIDGCGSTSRSRLYFGRRLSYRDICCSAQLHYSTRSAFDHRRYQFRSDHRVSLSLGPRLSAGRGASSRG